VFVASEGSVEWCRGGSGVWIYPSSRIDRVGRIYGACVCVRRRWLCCIARSRRAVHFRGGRSVVAVRPGDVIYQTDGNVIPPRLYTPVPTGRGWRPRPPLYVRAEAYTPHHPSAPLLLLFNNPSAERRISLAQTYVLRTHPRTHCPGHDRHRRRG
jgi:hypothetical protein